MIDILIDIIREKGRFPATFIFCWDIDIGHQCVIPKQLQGHSAVLCSAGTSDQTSLSSKGKVSFIVLNIRMIFHRCGL